MSFANFYNRNLACAKLAVIKQLEHRFNMVIEAVMAPCLTAVVEVALWYSIVASAPDANIGGFGTSSYLAYALWSAFLSRASQNWAYEWQMADDIHRGTINGILMRPVSFFEFYMSQFIGYKTFLTTLSLPIPALVTIVWLPSSVYFQRLPICLALVFVHLFVIHALSFCVSTMGFFVTKINGFTAAKNIALWVLVGELFPLDLMPEPWKSIVLNLPFASGVFIPVGYLTGRHGIDLVWHGFFLCAVSFAVLTCLGWLLWRRGLRSYTGTGA